MTSSLDQHIAAGYALAQQGSTDDVIAYFERLVAQFPDEARAHYELACARDRADREVEAVAAYRAAMQLGLSGDELRSAYLGLGSTLRNVGEYAESLQLLTEACARYPGYAPLRLFLALTQCSAGQERQAVIQLMDYICEHIDLDGYDRALNYYRNELKAAET
jgi:tetratricopeptide (TPR) repeat protein